MNLQSLKFIEQEGYFMFDCGCFYCAHCRI